MQNVAEFRKNTGQTTWRDGRRQLKEVMTLQRAMTKIGRHF